MKRKCLVFMLVIVSGMLTGCGQDGRYQVTMITEGTHALSGVVFGDLIIFGGEVTLQSDATLEGSAHLLAGKLNVEGVIYEDISLMAGELALGPQARIAGDLNVGTGQLSGLDQATVVGKVNTGSGMQLPDKPTAQPQNPAGTLLRWLFSAIVFGFAGTILELYIPQKINHVSDAALRHLPVSLSMGILVGITGLSLLVLLAYSILLIPVALLGLAILGLSVIYGWLACGIALGRWFREHLKIGVGPCWAIFGSTFIFVLFLNVMTAIPGIGGIFGIMVAAIGLGSVFLTRFGLRRFIPESAIPCPVDQD